MFLYLLLKLLKVFNVHVLRRFKFSAIFLQHLVPWPSVDIQENFMEIVTGEPLRRRELNPRRVAKYSDSEPIEGYISETVQDSR